MPEILQLEGQKTVCKQIYHGRAVEVSVIMILGDIGNILKGTHNVFPSRCWLCHPEYRNTDCFEEIEEEGQTNPAAASSFRKELRTYFVQVVRKLHKEVLLLLEGNDIAVE